MYAVKQLNCLSHIIESVLWVFEICMKKKKKLGKKTTKIHQWLEVTMCGLSPELQTVNTLGVVHALQIRTTIMGNICGAPDRLHVTWLSSQTASYASVTVKMPRGDPLPPFQPPLHLITQINNPQHP